GVAVEGVGGGEAPRGRVGGAARRLPRVLLQVGEPVGVAVGLQGIAAGAVGVRLGVGAGVQRGVGVPAADLHGVGHAVVVGVAGGGVRAAPPDALHALVPRGGAPVEVRVLDGHDAVGDGLAGRGRARGDFRAVGERARGWARGEVADLGPVAGVGDDAVHVLAEGGEAVLHVPAVGNAGVGRLPLRGIKALGEEDVDPLGLHVGAEEVVAVDELLQVGEPVAVGVLAARGGVEGVEPVVEEPPVRDAGAGG